MWRLFQGFTSPCITPKLFILFYTSVFPRINLLSFFALSLSVCVCVRFSMGFIYQDQSDIPLPKGLLPDESSPDWISKADNAWQLTATTMVCLQSVPGLVILYGSMVKKKWAVNSAFMAFYAFAAVLVCWVLWGHHMSFGNRLGPLVGRPNAALSQSFLLDKSKASQVPTADFVFYQFAFAAITVILLAGSLLGRMNIYAWMLFVPLWLTFSYTIGAFSIWGGGFLEQHIIDYAGGYVIHLSSGVAGFTAAYWVSSKYALLILYGLIKLYY